MRLWALRCHNIFDKNILRRPIKLVELGTQSSIARDVLKVCMASSTSDQQATDFPCRFLAQARPNTHSRSRSVTLIWLEIALRCLVDLLQSFWRPNLSSTSSSVWKSGAVGSCIGWQIMPELSWRCKACTSRWAAAHEWRYCNRSSRPSISIKDLCAGRVQMASLGSRSNFVQESCQRRCLMPQWNRSSACFMLPACHTNASIRTSVKLGSKRVSHWTATLRSTSKTSMKYSSRGELEMHDSFHLSDVYHCHSDGFKRHHHCHMMTATKSDIMLVKHLASLQTGRRQRQVVLDSQRLLSSLHEVLHAKLRRYGFTGGQCFILLIQAQTWLQCSHAKAERLNGHLNMPIFILCFRHSKEFSSKSWLAAVPIDTCRTLTFSLHIALIRLLKREKGLSISTFIRMTWSYLGQIRLPAGPYIQGHRFLVEPVLSLGFICLLYVFLLYFCAGTGTELPWAFILVWE